MKSRSRISFLLATFAALVAASALSSSSADAHIALTSPPPRHEDQKSGPCGVATGDARGNQVTTFAPGETITVTWQETIGHPGHFRISFDPDGVDGLVDPKSFSDFDTAGTVLLDNITDKSGTQTYSEKVTLPNVECDTCTLQVIQVMTDKPPYGDGNDIYYQCADIVLSGGTRAERDSGPPSAPRDAGSSSGSRTDGGAGSEAEAATGTRRRSNVEDGGCRTSGAPDVPGDATLVAVVSAALLRARRRRVA